MCLPLVTEIKYLGVCIVSSTKFKCTLAYAKQAFYCSANSLFDKVANAASEEVMIHLVNSKCFPVLLYGLEARNLNKSERNSINFTAMRFFMKIFRTSNLILVTESLFYFGVDSPSVSLETIEQPIFLQDM
jgi:hypothetical protein